MRLWMALALGLALAACSEKKGPTAPIAPPPPVSSSAVPTAPAKAARDVPLLESSGRVIGEPGSTSLVVPPLKGRVAEILVRPGQRVRAGDPLIGLVMPELLQAAASYTGAEAKFNAWTARKNQLQQLKAEGLSRAADFAEAETQLADAAAQKQLALATLKVAGIGPKQAEELLNGSGSSVLRAPKAGVVTDFAVQLGEVRDPSGAPLMRIESAVARQIEAKLIVPPSSTATYEAVASGRSAAAIPVRLVSSTPTVDSRDGTWTAWFEPAEPTNLVAGQPMIVRRVLAPSDAAVTVPAAGLVRTEEGTKVAVQVDGKFALRSVEVIAVSGSDAIVKGDVKVGEQVASDATRLPEGDGT